MKRRAILIGNTNGLSGVQVDISKFSGFLKSNTGGAWFDNEIDIIQNPKKEELLNKITMTKRQAFDYVIVLFSGHGGQERQTILEINENHETIEEPVLRNISTRQINIYDCCRCLPKRITESLEFTVHAQLSYDSVTNIIRAKYEKRIMQAIPQQVLLFSCAKGQYSYDTPDGGIYLGNFLKSAKKIDQNQDFKFVGIAHQEAGLLTSNDSDGKQTPEAFLPKCLSDQQLIISVNEQSIVSSNYRF